MLLYTCLRMLLLTLSPLDKERQEQSVIAHQLISLLAIPLSELQLMCKNTEGEFKSIFNFVATVDCNIENDLMLPRMCALTFSKQLHVVSEMM